MLRERDHPLALGGWANPHADPERQVDFLTATDVHAEFYLTQVVSHHHAEQVARFVAAPSDAASRSRPVRRLLLPQREPADAGRAEGFLPVPAEGLTREFAAGATPEDVCARTIRTLLDAGARHFYISNLPLGRAQTVLDGVLEKSEVTA